MQSVRLYVIYDRVAREGGPIFQAVNDGVAMRSYKAFMAQSPVSPEEYQLVCIGLYDPEVMKIDAFDIPLDVNKTAVDVKQLPLAEVVNE